MRKVRVRVTPGFLLLMAWLLYRDRQGILLLTLAACICHEGGHWAVLRIFGHAIKEINLTAVGAEMVLGEEMSCGQEVLAAAAGPAVNLILAGVSSRLLGGELFAGLNFVLAVFNLLPVGRLDGGRILKGILSWTVGDTGAQQVLDWTEGALSAILPVLAVWSLGRGGGVTLLLAALWVLFGRREGKIREKFGKRVVTACGKG